MTTMYDPDPHSLKTGPIAAFCFVVGSAAFGPANFPGYWWLYFCLSALMLCYTVYLIYFCERFTTFTLSMLSSFVFSFGFAAAGLAHVALLHDAGASNFTATAVNVSLFLLMIVIYAGVYFFPSKPFPFSIIENRVSRASVKSSGVGAGFIAGAGTLVSAFLINAVSSLTSSGVAVLGVFFSCVALIVYERRAIGGLRSLRLQERKLSTSYTFMQIDEIRQARSRWWLGRVLKWVTSWHKSPKT